MAKFYVVNLHFVLRIYSLSETYLKTKFYVVFVMHYSEAGYGDHSKCYHSIIIIIIKLQKKA
jgi:hypothetical protein